jgi:sulfoxide reductase heme-binding subunit YedZ
LFAAVYAGLHFLIFVILDLNLNFQQLLKTGAEKPFIILGSIALSILIMLTITSTRGRANRLGKKWNQLHRLIYLAGFLIMAHYHWTVKTPQGLPIILSSIMAILLILHIPLMRKWCKRYQPP